MKAKRRLSYGLCVSVAAMTALLSAPAVFAEDGHHGHGRGSDDAQVTTVRVDNDANEDVNDDRGVDVVQQQAEDVVDDND